MAGLLHPTSLCIDHLNLNCLTKKFNRVSSLLSLKNVDILGVSETWLMAATLDSFVNISGYEIVRSDSTDMNLKHGVAMCVRKPINMNLLLVAWVILLFCFFWI